MSGLLVLRHGSSYDGESVSDSSIGGVSWKPTASTGPAAEVAAVSGSGSPAPVVEDCEVVSDLKIRSTMPECLKIS